MYLTRYLSNIYYAQKPSDGGCLYQIDASKICSAVQIRNLASAKWKKSSFPETFHKYVYLFLLERLYLTTLALILSTILPFLHFVISSFRYFVISPFRVLNTT